MRRVGRVVGGSLLLALLLACGRAAGPSRQPSAILFSVFHDGAWKLTVDRTLRSGGFRVETPLAPLSEADYEPAGGGRTYLLTVADKGGRLEVKEPAMAASLVGSNGDELRYEIVSGAFAGGRVVVRRDESGLQGELTIYGSGVPILQSERGPLEEVR